jgi:hypothetical protein
MFAIRLGLIAIAVLAIGGAAFSPAGAAGESVTINVPVEFKNINNAIKEVVVVCSFSYNVPGGDQGAANAPESAVAHLPLVGGAYSGKASLKLTVGTSAPDSIVGWHCFFYLYPPNSAGLTPMPYGQGPEIAQAADGSVLVKYVKGTFESRLTR